jgi:hypothetical protein
MRYRHWTLTMAMVASLVAGCGGSDESPPPAANPSQPDTTAAADPVESVKIFLEAVRRGDDATAAAMFTQLAREKASEMNIEVAPKGSDTAQFEVFEAEHVDDELAKVPSTWSDYDAEGQLRTDKMAWMLRREPEGWRVAGMAATVFEGEPPLLLDFENPEETLRKLDLLREEIVRRSEPEAYQAVQPASPAGEVRR